MFVTVLCIAAIAGAYRASATYTFGMSATCEIIVLYIKLNFKLIVPVGKRSETFADSMISNPVINIDAAIQLSCLVKLFKTSTSAIANAKKEPIVRRCPAVC